MSIRHTVSVRCTVPTLAILCFLPVILGYNYIITAGHLKYQDIHAARYRRNSAAAAADRNLVIGELHINSRVASRFATTDINSQLENTMRHDAEAKFVVQIPETAFISHFSMIIDGFEYVAEVKSKDEALNEYEKAQEENRTAGHVSHTEQSPAEAERGYELFTLSVNVKAMSRVVFKLEYQQLLERKFGLYENRISIRPNQVVGHLSAEINIYEPQGIKDLTVFEPSFTNSVEPVDTVVTVISESVQKIHYQPSIERQRLIDADGNFGDLIIRYDVHHDVDIGLLQRQDEYFVHFFSPSEDNLQVLGKNIVFVIDISGSMSGRKMTQTREAMTSILRQLNSDDRFLLMLFDNRQEFWPTSKELIDVNDDTITAATAHADSALVARGGTDIHGALVQACGVMRRIDSVRGKDMIVFLTDGQPTSGVTDPAKIIQHTVEACGNTSIFSLGFGFDLNYELLESISYRTNGFTMRIYEEADSAMQLQDFFRQISRPLLYNVIVSYPTNLVALNTLTSTSFAQYFAGSELVVTGKFHTTEVDEMDVNIQVSATSRFSYASVMDTSQVDPPLNAVDAVTSGYIEKLYVYMKIKDLLRETLMLDDPALIRSTRQHALRLALEYKLVTPLTSMIISERQVSNSAVLDEAPMRDVSYGRGAASSSAASSPSNRGVGAVLLSLAVASLTRNDRLMVGASRIVLTLACLFGIA